MQTLSVMNALLSTSAVTPLRQCRRIEAQFHMVLVSVLDLTISIMAMVLKVDVSVFRVDVLLRHQVAVRIN